MRMVELTHKELSSVPCPTCGVAAGERCHLHSGLPCFEPHLDWKLCAIEALENKKEFLKRTYAQHIAVRNSISLALCEPHPTAGHELAVDFGCLAQSCALNPSSRCRS